MTSAVEGRDGSANNRYAAWSAALKLLHWRPWSGIGTGDGGHVYSVWYQPDNLNYRYRYLLNGYLDIGVEWGIPAMWIYGATLFSCVIVGLLLPFYAGSIPINSIVLCGITAMVVFVAACLTDSYITSIWARVLWFGFSVALLYFVCRNNPRLWYMTAALSSVLVAIGILCLFFAGNATVGSKYRVSRVESDAVVLSRLRKGEEGTLVICVDTDVSGPLYGRFVADLLDVAPYFQTVVVLDPRVALRELSPRRSSAALLIGSCSRPEIRSKVLSNTYFLMHPVGYDPREDWGETTVTVLLPKSIGDKAVFAGLNHGHVFTSNSLSVFASSSDVQDAWRVWAQRAIASAPLRVL